MIIKRFLSREIYYLPKINCDNNHRNYLSNYIIYTRLRLCMRYCTRFFMNDSTVRIIIWSILLLLYPRLFYLPLKKNSDRVFVMIIKTVYI